MNTFSWSKCLGIKAIFKCANLKSFSWFKVLPIGIFCSQRKERDFEWYAKKKTFQHQPMEFGMAFGLDIGLEFGLKFGMEFGMEFQPFTFLGGPYFKVNFLKNYKSNEAQTKLKTLSLT